MIKKIEDKFGVYQYGEDPNNLDKNLTHVEMVQNDAGSVYTGQWN